MVWSAPMTWSTGFVVKASDFNQELRDNFLVTAPAIMTAQGDILIASGANAPARLAKSTTSTQYLANTGTSNAPAWNEVALATGVSGTLPVGSGGTGATSLTAGSVLIGNGTSAVTLISQTTKGQLLVGDGSGAPQMLAVGSNDQVLTAASGETTGTKWATPAADVHIFRRKTSTQTVNNSTTKVSDATLQFSVAANSVYAVVIALQIAGPTGADFKCDFTGPSGMTEARAGIGAALGTSDVLSNLINLSAVSGAADYIVGTNTGTRQTVLLHALFITSGTAGTVILRWAQQVAVSGDTDVGSRSWLLAHKVE